MNLSSQSTFSADGTLHLSNVADMSTVDMRKVAELVRQLAQARFEANRLQRLLPTAPGSETTLMGTNSRTPNRDTSSARPATTTTTTTTAARAATASHTPRAPLPAPSHRSDVAAPPPHNAHRGTEAIAEAAPPAPPVRGDRHWKQRYSAVKAQLRAERQQQEEELHDIFALVESITSEADHTRLRGENMRLQRQVAQLLGQRDDPSTATPTSPSTSPAKPAVSAAASMAPRFSPSSVPSSLAQEQSLALVAPALSASSVVSAREVVPEDTLTAFLLKEVEAWRHRCATLEHEKTASLPPTATEGTRPATASAMTTAAEGLNSSTMPACPSPPPPAYQPPSLSSPAVPLVPSVPAHLDPFHPHGYDVSQTQSRSSPRVPMPRDPFVQAEERQAERVQHELSDQQRRYPVVPGGLTGDYAAGSPHWHAQQPSPSRPRRGPRQDADAPSHRHNRPPRQVTRARHHRQDRRGDQGREAKPRRRREASSSSASSVESRTVNAASPCTSFSDSSASEVSPRRAKPSSANARRRHGRRADRARQPRRARTSSAAASASASRTLSSSSSSSSRTSSSDASSREDAKRRRRHRHRRDRSRHAHAKHHTQSASATTASVTQPRETPAAPAAAPATAPAAATAAPPCEPYLATLPHPYVWPFGVPVPPNAYMSGLSPPSPLPPPAALAAMGGFYPWHPASAYATAPPPLPPAPSSTVPTPSMPDPGQNIYQDLLHLPLFAGPSPPTAPTLFATPFRQTPAPVHGAAAQAVHHTVTGSVPPPAPPMWSPAPSEARPPPWRPSLPPAAMEPTPTSAPTSAPAPAHARARLARDIARHDELLAAISTLQSAAADEAFQRPRA